MSYVDAMHDESRNNTRGTVYVLCLSQNGQEHATTLSTRVGKSGELIYLATIDALSLRALPLLVWPSSMTAEVS
jgi:hypothetical protein